MSLKKTLALAVVLAVAFFYILKVEVPKQEEEALKENLFPRLAASQIKQFEITRRDPAGQTVSYKLENSAASPALPKDPKRGEEDVATEGWSVRGIPHSRLDRGYLTSLVRSLQTLKPDKKIPSEEIDSDRGLYGLKDPEAVLKVVQADGNERTLRFGKRSEYLAMRFLEVLPEGAIYTIPEDLFLNVNRARDDFRERSPFSAFDDGLNTLTLKKGGLTIGLAKADANAWKLTVPFEKKASEEQLSALRQEIRNIRVLEFHDLEGDSKDPVTPESLGLDHPDMSIAYSVVRDGKTVEHVMAVKKSEGGTGGANWIRLDAEPVYYRIGVDLTATVKDNPDVYRDRKFFTFDADAVREVRIHSEGRADVTLVRGNGSEWTVNGKPGDVVFISEFLRNLGRLEAGGFPAESKDFGFSAPRYKATVITEKEVKPPKPGAELEKTEHVLVVGGEAPKELLTLVDMSEQEKAATRAYYAAAGEDGEPFLVSVQQVMKISPAEEALLKRAKDDEVDVQKVPLEAVEPPEAEPSGAGE